MLIDNLGTGELILIALVVLLFFCFFMIPELLRGMGKGVKSFKEGLNDIEKENKEPHTPKNQKNKRSE